MLVTRRKPDLEETLSGYLLDQSGPGCISTQKSSTSPGTTLSSAKEDGAETIFTAGGRPDVHLTFGAGFLGPVCHQPVLSCEAREL